MRYSMIFVLFCACSGNDAADEPAPPSTKSAVSAPPRAEAAAGAPSLTDEELERLLDALEQQLELDSRR